MKINALLLSFLFCFFFQPSEVQSKNKQGTHTFKIVGSKTIPQLNGRLVVEYDPESNDHLYISSFDNVGNIVSKRQYLFTGKKFNIAAGVLTYLANKQLLRDSLDTYFRKDGTIERTVIYKENKGISPTLYYPNGQKQQFWSLSGEYKYWYPNGQLSVSGYFKDDLKDGDFVQFDESGAIIKQGVYKEGKLISGERVVADVIHLNPDIPAKYEGGEEAFNQYLTQKASSLDASKLMLLIKEYSLEIVFDKNGKMTDIMNLTAADSKEEAIIQYLLKDCPAFRPALFEGIPVKCQQRMSLQFSKSGVLLKKEERVATDAEEMPEFPGGQRAMLAFISSNLKYPVDAAIKGIQGRVFISFIVDKNGKITNVKVAQGIHPLLDAEACRVAMSMPNWKPARNDGKPVSMIFTMPINFVLQWHAPSPVN